MSIIRGALGVAGLTLALASSSNAQVARPSSDAAAKASTTDAGSREAPKDSRSPSSDDAIQARWGAAEQEWRVRDAEASDLLTQPGNACTSEVSEGFDEAEHAVRNLIALKRDYYKGLFDWYAKRYEATGTVFSDLGPQLEALTRQRAATENELGDLKRRDRALASEKTAQAQADLRAIINEKLEQIDNLRQAVDQLNQGRGKVQEERRIAANVRGNIAEIMNKLRSEETLFDAFYRHQRAAASLKCTTEGKILLPPGRLTLPRKGSEQ